MAVINQQDVTNIVSAINACPDCTQLTAYAQKQFDAWYKQMQDAIKAKASANAKKVAPGASISDIINWINTFVAEAQAGYAAAVLEITEIGIAYATITATITAKAAALSCGAIPIPPLPIP
jgi:hypothetical protein